jgi:predicted PurR-regulated permease PerM
MPAVFRSATTEGEALEDEQRMLAERVLMSLLVGGVAVGCTLILYPFFSAILWAGILVFTTWPAYERVRQRLRIRRTAAAALMVGITAVVVVLPLALAAPSGATDVEKLRAAVNTAIKGGLPGPPGWLSDVPAIGDLLANLWRHWAADLSLMVETFRPYFGIIAEGGFSLLLGIANGVVSFVFALFIAFFFYANGETIAARLQALIRRIAGERADRLIEVTGQTIRGTVYGILGTAIVQGILTAFGLWLSGVPRPVSLGAVAGFLAVFPIGAPLVWIPASLWLLGTGSTGWGIFLALYGVLAVSGADNVIRPWFISRGAQLPFVLTAIGVIGGALAFGLLGIFLGPVLLGVGFTLVNEWALDQSRPAGRPVVLAELSRSKARPGADSPPDAA